MILSVLDLHGYGIYAIDGDIGNVDEFYFDDDTWTIRCLVTQTGDWFSDRRVLVSPISVRWVDWQNRRLAVSLYRYEVRNSPDIDVAKPISRQHEIEFNRYYGWTNYWTGPGLWGGGIIPGDLWARLKPESPGLETKENPAGVAEEKDTRDTHLRSTKEVIGYHIHATDGEIGHATDFLFDDKSWQIQQLVVDTSTWWPGKKVIIPPTRIKSIVWAERQIVVDMRRDTIQQSHEFNPDTLSK